MVDKIFFFKSSTIYMSCNKSSIYNPMSNFMPFDDRTKQPACRENIENTTGIYGYTMPVTTSAPDTMGFANFLFPNPARCRETGYMCVVNADCTKNLDRLAYYANEKHFQPITNPKATLPCKYQQVYR